MIFCMVLHYGGPDGEIGASLRYLSQRFTMPNRMTAAVLNDIGNGKLTQSLFQQAETVLYVQNTIRKFILFTVGAKNIRNFQIFYIKELVLNVRLLLV